MPKPPTGSKEELLAMDAYVKLMRAADAATSSTHQHLADVDLTPSQFGVLEVLYHLGPMCQRDIGRKILKSSGNMTTVIDNLEKRGLVERRRDALDRRFISIHLMPKGKELIRLIFPRHRAGIADGFRVLTREEQLELARLCRKLGLGIKPR